MKLRAALAVVLTYDGRIHNPPLSEADKRTLERARRVVGRFARRTMKLNRPPLTIEQIGQGLAASGETLKALDAMKLMSAKMMKAEWDRQVAALRGEGPR